MRILILYAVFSGPSCGSGSVVRLETVKISHAAEYQPVEKIAVIVEPRRHKLLILIVKNVMAVLGDGWKIQIFHGTANEDFIAASELKQKIQERKIYLSRIDRENLDVSAYNALMLSPDFWGEVLGENVLIFQTDSVLCSSSGIKPERFFDYDYVGAPWPEGHGTCIIGKLGQNYYAVADRDITPKIRSELSEIQEITYQKVGNGGLSFRKRSKMLEILNKIRPLGTAFESQMEDVFWACIGTDSRFGVHLAPVEIAQEFSVDSKYYHRSFGVHKPWFSLNKEEVGALEGSCQELGTILRPYYYEKNMSKN